MSRLLAGTLMACAASVVLAAQSAYVPERVLATGTGTMTDFEAMLADLASADVIFLGEQHDDPNTHRLELAVLQGLQRRRGDLVLSLEMFERDVQEPLEHFLMGHTPEQEFLAGARPWPRYDTDYKPLVDFAMAHQWSVVAANVPRPIANEISKEGLGVLAGKPDAERGWFARDLQCPLDGEYFDRFGQAMGGHPAEGQTVAAQRQMVERFYQAQCVKDETMAESIAGAYTAAAAGAKRPAVVHVNGAFHSDFHLGTAERVRRRLPAQRVVVVTMMPVANLDTIAPTDDDRRRADYLVHDRVGVRTARGVRDHRTVMTIL
ncbi:MAG: ChaN family lipoprotein [Vicinamibacterales bacterium]